MFLPLFYQEIMLIMMICAGASVVPRVVRNSINFDVNPSGKIFERLIVEGETFTPGRFFYWWIEKDDNRK